MAHLVAPSLLAADFGNLQRDIEMVNQSEADWFHLDIMDGVFVPNISYGMPLMKTIARHATKPLDVHLMIVDPDRYLSTFAELGAHILTVHYEACTHLHRTIQAIRNLGMKAGVALNPHTPVESLRDILGDLDLVLVMSVNPGFGGQAFIDNTFDRLERLQALKTQGQNDFIIEVDGGVGEQNASRLIKAGANALVAGSSIFKEPHPIDAIAGLKHV